MTFLLSLSQWFWTLVILIGIAGLIATWVMKLNPQIILYRIPIQILSIIFIISGVYHHGKIDNEKKWKERTEKIEQELREKEKLADDLNKQIQKEIDEKKKVEDEKNKKILEYLDKLKKENREKNIPAGPERVITEKIIEYIEKCPVPKTFIDMHNEAAKGAGK